MLRKSKRSIPTKKPSFKRYNKIFGALTEFVDKIWVYEDVVFREPIGRSFNAYQGFTVNKGLAGIPTAVTAEYGSGEPVIGIWVNVDALPGLSQKTVPVKDLVNPGGAGHIFAVFNNVKAGVHV